MVHIMFQDSTACDVSFSNAHTHTIKDEPRTLESQNKLCLPKREGGQMEAEGQGQVKETLCDRGEVYLKNRESEAKAGRRKRGVRAPEVHNDMYCSFTGSHD